MNNSDNISCFDDVILASNYIRRHQIILELKFLDKTRPFACNNWWRASVPFRNILPIIIGRFWNFSVVKIKFLKKILKREHSNFKLNFLKYFSSSRPNISARHCIYLNNTCELYCTKYFGCMYSGTYERLSVTFGPDLIRLQLLISTWG